MFVLLALPRSRTKWLSEFLTYGDIRCFHEKLSECEAIEDLRWLGNDGTAETFGTSVWRKLYRRFPRAKYVVVRRDPSDVANSIARLGINRPLGAIARTLDEAAAELPALVVEYDDINARLREIWAHCRGDAFPDGRETMTEQRIVCDLQAMLAGANVARMRRIQWNDSTATT